MIRSPFAFVMAPSMTLVRVLVYGFAPVRSLVCADLQWKVPRPPSFGRSFIF